MKNLLDARVNFPLVKYTLKKQKNLLVIFTLLLSITFPFAIVVRLISSSSTEPFQNTEGSKILLYFFTVVLLLCIPFIFFNYLTSKRSVDYMHSLPIKRRDLYASFTLLSLLFVIIPFTIAYWSGYFLLYSFNDLSFSLDHIFYFIRSILIFGAVQSSTLFVIMNTGTTSDSIIYSMILFIAPFIVYGAFEIFASTYIIGVESFGSTNLLLFLSPTAALAQLATSGITTISPNYLLLFWIVVSLVFHAVTVRLYECWKSERSELPFNNPIFFTLVTSLFVAFFLIFSLSIFSIDSSSRYKFLAIQNLLLPLLMSFVLYVTLDTIRKRSFRRITKSIKRFSLIAGVTLTLTTLVYVTQGFGYSNDLPELDDVESVSITTSLGYTDTVLMGLSSYPIVINNPQEIKIALDVHQNLVDIFKGSNKFFNAQSYQSQYYPDLNSWDKVDFNVQYTLKSGKKLKRSYTLPQAMFELTYPLLETEVFQEALQPLFDKTAEVSNLTLFNSILTEQYDYNPDEIHRLLKEEYFALPYEEALNRDEALEFVLLYSFEDKTFLINIDARYPRTLAALKAIENPKQVAYDTYFVGTEDPDFANYGLAYTDWYASAGTKKLLSLKETEELQVRSRGYNLNGLRHEFIIIQLESDLNDEFVKIPLN